MTPTKFGRYEIRSELGRGGMATVFYAYDPRFERDVAIKVLPHEFLHDPQFRARFEREAKTIALIEHPAIVPVYDFGEEDGQPYIVMRYMAGGSLADRLQKGPLSLKEIAHFVSRLAPALDAAHQKGIVHRDLKPGNILFDQYDNAYISDFGIARLNQGAAGVSLTGTAILGTPAYMSPEQVQGDKEIDGRSDLYSFGVILFQMLTGTTPYRADTPAKMMMMHLLEPVPQIRDLKQDVSPEMEMVTERMLAKDREDRYSTARDLAEAIEQAARGEMPTPPAGNSAAATRLASGAGPAASLSKPKTAPPKSGAQAGGRTALASGSAETELQAAPRPGIPAWGWALGAIGVLGLLGVVALSLVVAVSTGLLSKAEATPTLPGKLAAALTTATDSSAAIPATEVVKETVLLKETQVVEAAKEITAVEATATAAPSNTIAPSATAAPSETATLTPEPSATPLPTETPVPEVVTIGGADRIALFDKNNDIWVMGVDGSNPQQLTSDGTIKEDLQWSPDGNAVVYISGNCAKMVAIETGRVDDIACFDAANVNTLSLFQISPDGKQVAIVFYQQLYVVPYDLAQLSETRKLSTLKNNAVCPALGPYASTTGTAIAVKWVQWSTDMQRMAVDFLGAVQGKQVDLIDVLDISNCEIGPQRKDQFPATRFSIKGYDANPIIESFTWDGESSFVLIGGTFRNGGFADMYFYNAELHKGEQINPLRDVTCCYRDPHWSPDGSYLVFAFQDIALGEGNLTQIYIIRSGSLGNRAIYTPLSLPDGFFANKRDVPMPVFRPAK